MRLASAFVACFWWGSGAEDWPLFDVLRSSLIVRPVSLLILPCPASFSRLCFYAVRVLALTCRFWRRFFAVFVLMRLCFYLTR
jgi:hypothetical protein